MDTLGVTGQERRFHLDEEAIADTFVHPTAHLDIPYHNHGKSIVRDKEGLWFCAFVSSRGLVECNYLGIAVSRTPESVGGDMHPAVWLLGGRHPSYTPLFEANHGKLANVCILMDEGDTVHVLYSDKGGIWRFRGDASRSTPYQRLKESLAWTGPEQLTEAGSLLCDATWLPPGDLVVYFTRGETLCEQVLGRPTSEVCQEAEHATVHVTVDGTRHIAFERDRRVLYVRSADGRTWTDAQGNPGPEMVAYFCSSWPSIGVTSNGKTVIAYQGEGKVDLKRYPELYDRLRPGGGSTVSYAVCSDGQWRIHDFLRSSEMLLKRQVSSNLNVARAGGFGHFMEEFWRPSVAVDKHGVLWMFYLNTTRRHIYFARFHGETFGDYVEARGTYDCLSRVLFLQKDSCSQAGIGFMTVASNQLYFDHLPVPEYSSADKRRVVFLDNLEVDECVGLEHKLGVWQKHPEPIFGAGVCGDSRDDHICWCDVRRTDEGFEMHYMGMGSLYKNSMPGRAFSKDGLHFEKREPFEDAMLTLDGKPFPSSFWRPVYLEDAGEPDASRRFKGVLGHYNYEKGIETRSWVVVTSPDGLNWHTVPGLPRVLLGDISVRFHLLRDDEDKNPSRRYKMLLLMGSNAGRAAAVFTSPDLIYWDKVNYLREDPDSVTSSVTPWPTGPIALDPDAAESPWEEEVHDAVLWRENGLLMFHYDAFYFHANQHTNKALALSRDGRHYYRINRGAVNMPHGNCGEWDSGRDRTCVPLHIGDELWLYFCGAPAGHFSDADQSDYLTMRPGPPSPEDNRRFAELRPWRVGLARLRQDGWAYMQLQREAGCGYLTTIPFEYCGGRLVVNGSGLGEGGMRVEVRSADNRSAVPGFEQENCRFNTADGVSVTVTWGKGAELRPGVYRLRFFFEGLRAKLYSFGFERKET